MKKYRITQVKSRIGQPDKQKKTLDALGIRKMNNPVLIAASPQVEGMIGKVSHLVKVEEVTE